MTQTIHRFANERLLRSGWDLGGKAPFLGEMQRQGRTTRVEILSIGKERVRVPDDVAMFAGFEGLVLVRKRRYFADDVPVQLAQSYIPWKIARGTQMEEEDTGPGGIYRLLEEKGHMLWRFREQISVYRPGAAIAELLALDERATVTRILRVAYAMSGAAVEICDTVMPSDRFTLVYEVSPDGLPGGTMTA